MSLCAGDYYADKSAGIEAEGVRYLEVKCSVDIADCLRVNDEIFAKFDDKVIRLKISVLLYHIFSVLVTIKSVNP